LNIPALNRWDTAPFSGTGKYDAWSDVLTSNYGRWAVAKPTNSQFEAKLRAASAGGLKIIDCVCDPCEATRDARLVRQDDAEFLAIQLVLAGREHMRFDGDAFALQAGDIFVWDSTRPMTFKVTERLHKISLLMPLERLKSWMPSNWQSMPHKLPEGSANRILLSSLIKTMVDEHFTSAAIDDRAICEATIAILTGGMSNQGEAAQCSQKQGQLERLKHFIGLHLANPELGVDMIATRNRISVRYLHWVFSGSGSTVTEYITRQRLEGCRRDLQNPLMFSRSIAAICYAYGFSNQAHFSKRYRQLFGETPSTTRERTQDQS
jgi:AraC-like DNA-binding protein